MVTHEPLAKFFYSSPMLGGGQEGVDVSPLKSPPPLTPPNLGGRIERRISLILQEPLMLRSKYFQAI